MTDPDQGDDLDQYAQLEPEDTLEDRGVDPLDEGYSPPERPFASEDWGTTPEEEREGESIERRLARELPDDEFDDEDGDQLGDTSDTDGELYDDEVGEERAGRLAATGGAFVDDDELFAEDEGYAGGAASAEEAAVHTVPDED
ncbi:DUF5709 domain-containing protein [Pseudonocardia sp. CA-107938]|uniref:DUF5709 domain-containing protein n=1 Tax=Pseudonocardia sp. CA-107938 TaxID=3240021 RepID=UPI003D8F71C5